MAHSISNTHPNLFTISVEIYIKGNEETAKAKMALSLRFAEEADFRCVCVL